MSRNQREFPLLFLAVVMVVIVARATASMWIPDSPGLVEWVPADRAVELSMQENKPIFYEFGAEWCMPCKRMEQDVFSDPMAAGMIRNKYVPVRVVDRRREDGINPPNVQALEDQFDIDVFPTLVVYDPNLDRVLGKLRGYPGRDEVEEFIRNPGE